MPDSAAKAVAELLMRDRYVDNEMDAWRAAKWILGVAQEPTRQVPPLRVPRRRVPPPRLA
jgi:hypothetical protein